MSVLTEKVVKRFGCSTCRKTWAGKSKANAHVVAGCIHDPETRACATCKHDNRGSVGGWEEGPGEEAHCEIGARESFDLYVRACPKWEAQHPSLADNGERTA